MQKACVLITGASGFIGSHLIAYLLARDYAVVGMTRQKNKLSRHPSLIWIQQLDELKTDRIDYVINLAGENIGKARWTAKRKQQLIQSRVETTQQLYRYLEKRQIFPKRIISGSDVGNYLVVSNLEKSVNDSLAIRLTVVSETGDSLKSFLIDRFESQEAKSITVLASGQYYLTGRVNNSDTLNAELVGLIDLEDSFDMTIANDLSIVSSERFGRSTVASGIKTIDKINSINYALFTDELIPLDAVYESNFVFRKYDKITNNKLAFYSGTNGLNEYLSDIDQSFSGIFMAIGTQVDPNDNSKRMYGTTINASYLGVLNEDNIEGGPTHGEGVAVSRSIEDGFFWVLGNEIKVGGQDRNIWVGKVDANNLQAVFSRKFGGSNNDDTGSKILQLDNGDVLILGTMEVVNQKKIVLIKIKQDGSF